MNRLISILTTATLALVICLTAVSAQASVAWTKLARQVGQNETHHEEAIRRLRQIKNLDHILIKALETSQRSLALDVITALELRDLVPELLQRVAADEDGFLVLTLNSLLTPENKSLILETYRENLRPDGLPIYSAAAIVAMMEPLARLGIPLPKKTVLSLFEHEFPEVRMAAFDYVRQQILRFRNRDHSDLVLKALLSNPIQLRIRAVYLIEELSTRPDLQFRLDPSAIRDACRNEKNPSLQKKCLALVKQESSDGAAR